MPHKEVARPSVEYATGQSSIKGEDVLFVRSRVSFPKSAAGGRLVGSHEKNISDSASSVHVSASGLQASLELEEQGRSNSAASVRRRNSLPGTGAFGLFAIFDGHNGVHAAQHLEETLLSTLEERLPAGHPPPEDEEPAHGRWREELQRALVEAFCELNEAFACKGKLAGATITVVIQYGWLLTVASCGDSRALLDTGHEVLQLTVDHRISTHQADRRRLQAMGAQIAPIDGSGNGPATNSLGYGPLRVWPGGLCLSRGIGDFDIGPPVIACPHIFQVKVPSTGGRLIIGSDGIWDGFENMRRLCRMSRGWNCQVAPNKTIQALQRAYGGLRDDTTIIVLDLTPPQTTFSDVAQKAPKKQQASAGSCFCFAPSPVDTTAETAPDVEKIVVHADLDVAAAIGLMPASEEVTRPVWCDADFCAMVSHSQEAACKAWSEARSLVSQGMTPSRQDLAAYFSAVHQLKPLADAGGGRVVDPHDLDVSVRPETQKPASFDGGSRPASVFPVAGPQMQPARPASEPPEGSQGDASTRFSEHVADAVSFARKFGHYKNQMGGSSAGGERSDEGSTTEDDSMRAGAEVGPAEGSDDSHDGGTSAAWQARAAEAGWVPPCGFVAPGTSPPRHKSSLYQLDSAMLSPPQASGLPTVDEEPAARRSEPKPAADEMAVRRGKNRFTGEDATEAKQAGSGLPRGGKPPLPKQVSA